MKNSDQRAPMKLRCGDCETRFDGPLLPMIMTKVVQYLAGVHCPSCGADAGRIFSAPKEAT